MPTEGFRLGSGKVSDYRQGSASFVTFVLTEDCNLRCSYCYIVKKHKSHVMPREIAYRAVDYILDMPNPKPGVVLEMIGGEPTLEIELMGDIARYFRDQVAKKPCHPWRTAYRISVGTNGTTYHTPEMQRFIRENRGHLSVSITIDGVKAKHDMHRVFADGRGSYDIVHENVKLWLRQFPRGQTKVTFGSEDLIYLCDSILHLWDMGIGMVPANVVFENVWKTGDAEIFEGQLRRLADVAVAKGYWKNHDTTLFWQPSDEDVSEDDQNWCGTGEMFSIDHLGTLYPCIRFQDYSISKPGRRGRPIGSILRGHDEDRLRAFHCLRKSLQSKQGCMGCEMSEKCAWCSGWNYDAADSDTIFVRATHICEMHKARWRANKYCWDQLKTRCGFSPPPRRGASMCPL